MNSSFIISSALLTWRKTSVTYIDIHHISGQGSRVQMCKRLAVACRIPLEALPAGNALVVHSYKQDSVDLLEEARQGPGQLCA